MRAPLVHALLLAACTSPADPPPWEDLATALDPAPAADAGPDLPRGEVPRERGSLVELVEREPTTAATGGYQAPREGEAAQFRQAMALLLVGEGERAVPLLSPLGYTVTDFTDDVFEPARPRRFYVVREPAVGRRHLGIYLLRRDPDRGHVFLEAPFGTDSFIEHLQRQGVRTLLSADIGGFFLNTADRCASADMPTNCIRCAGTCLRCRGIDRSYFPVSDQGHAEGTFFQAAHEAVTADPRAVVLSVHGHANMTAGYVVSDGTKQQAGADALVHRLGRAYAAATGLMVRSCNDGTSRELCGETLLQGRHTNGYAPLCTGVTPRPERRFLVLQQLYDVRRADGTAGPGTRTLLAQAIMTVWP